MEEDKGDRGDTDQEGEEGGTHGDEDITLEIGFLDDGIKKVIDGKEVVPCLMEEGDEFRREDAADRGVV